MSEDDIPPEFIDPIMYRIMENPVMLPKQGIDAEQITLDRWTLAKHFTENGLTDPFTRKNITNDEIISNTALLERILKWKKDNPEMYKNYKMSKPRSARTDPLEQEFDVFLKDFIPKFVSQIDTSEQLENHIDILNSLIYIQYRREHPYELLNRYERMDSQYKDICDIYNKNKYQLKIRNNDLEHFIKLYNRLGRNRRLLRYKHGAY